MRIVLALDGSPSSQAAIAAVGEMPWRTKPFVTVVTALVQTPFETVPTEAGIPLRQAEQQAATAVFEEAAGALGPYCQSVEQVVERQHPKVLILDVAKRTNADLVVVASRGHNAAYRVVLGSTADYVANHAKCSVLVVKPSEDRHALNDAGFRVLVAYDGSKGSQEAYRQVCELDWPQGKTSMHLSMVLERPKLLPENVVYDPPQIAESESVLEALQRPEAIVPDVKQSVRESLHIGNALHDLAMDEDSNLLFIGSTGKSAIARFFLGSTSRHLLHHAPCSIWLARTKQWD